jgi:adenylyltransferase/sulfurtransferase
MEAIKVILGVGRTLAGRLQIFDALDVTWRELEVRRDPGCPVCGDQPSQQGLIDYELFCGVSSASEGPRVTPQELVEVLGRDPRPFLLDVREPFEWEICNLASLGAVLIPRGDLENRLDEIPRERPVVVYCRTGGRSRAVQSLLLERGFTDVVDLEGGILACEHLDPTIQRY